jgi:hypothetical protein
MYSYRVMPTVTNPKAKIVADLSFQISSRKEKIFYYKFAEGDTIIFNAWTIKGKDISEVSITKWPTTTVFNSWAIPVVENKKIFIEKSSVYSIGFKNSSIISSKSYKFVLHRVPTNEKFIDFNTEVEWDTFYDTTYVSTIKYALTHTDTIPEEIINRQVKIGSKFSGNTRTYMQISLPKGTSYWVYWIGVGQEAAQGLQGMISQLPKSAGVLGITDPVTAFAIGLVPNLFSLSKGYDINYYLIHDYDNASKFKSGEVFYSFKKGEKIITEYAKMKEPKGGIFYLGLSNSYSMMTSKKVTVKCVAVKIIPRYEILKIKKPVIKARLVPKMEK